QRGPARDGDRVVADGVPIGDLPRSAIFGKRGELGRTDAGEVFAHDGDDLALAVGVIERIKEAVAAEPLVVLVEMLAHGGMVSGPGLHICRTNPTPSNKIGFAP